MNQSSGKSTTEEGQNDHAAKNRVENLKEMESSKPSTAADRKEIVKNLHSSPTRTTTPKDGPTVTNRKDETKAIPKLTEDKSKKSIPAKAAPNNKNKPNIVSQLPTSKKKPAPRVSLAPNSKANSPATSKIPALKQMPTNKTNLNNKTNARSEKSPSDSKLSINQNNNVNKVEPNTSKSNCSTVSPSARVKGNLKIQTARSAATPAPIMHKRSASNMSSRSTPPPLGKREELPGNLRKITSIAGDYNKPNNLASNSSSHHSTTTTKKQQQQPETNLQKILSTAGDQQKIDCLEKKLEEARDDELLKLPQLFLAADAVSDFKEKIKNGMDNYFASLLDNLKDTNEDSTSGLNIETKDKLEKLQVLKSNNILSLIDDWCSIQEDSCDAQIIKMQKELLDSNKTLKQLEKTLSESSKHHDEALFNLGKDIQTRADADLAHKDAEMKELTKKLKWLEKQNDNLKTTLQNTEKEDKADKSHLQEEIKTSKESHATLQKKLHTLEQQLKSDKHDLKLKNEIIKKLETDLVEKKKLEAHLADMTLKVQELRATPPTAGNTAEHLQQISELQNVVNSLESERQQMETKNEKLEAEVAALIVAQTKLRDAEKCIQDLQNKLEAKETSQDCQTDYVKDVQMEFAKFRQADAEKRREIEKLKVELSKFQYNMCQLEEEIQRGQQLLEVRCELINSLQTNEKTQRIHMEELFAQVAEKNNTINELNGELRTKSEEFRNLFTTIGAKQMELSNQEHMIKLLEDSNERSQMLRVKQEEKIGRMEEELAHLKQTISIYQANILSGNHGKNVLYAPILPANSGDFNENFYYYASQRRRKRQVDINVKKYEA